MLKRRRSCLKTRVGLLIALSILLVVLIFYFTAPDLFELAELRLLDWRTRLRGPTDPGRTVKLILIDARSREHYGMNEDMRFALGGLLSDLCRKGARAIGLDVFFIPDPGGPADPSRVALADAIKKCGNVVIGYEWRVDIRKTRLGEAEAVGRLRLLDATRKPGEKGFTPEDIPEGAEPLDPAIAKNAAAMGFFTVVADPLNFARKIPATLVHNGNPHYPFSLAVARVFLRQSDYEFPKTVRIPFLGPYLKGVNLATDPFGYLWLDQYGTADAFERLSFEDAVAHGVPEDFAGGSVILFGVSGDESNDQFATMFDPNLPGVVLHATAVANALSRGFLWRDGLVRGLEVALMALCALAMGFLIPRLHPVLSICLGPALIVILWLLADRLLGNLGIWIQLLNPVLLIILVHVGVLTARITVAERQCARLEAQTEDVRNCSSKKATIPGEVE